MYEEPVGLQDSETPFGGIDEGFVTSLFVFGHVGSVQFGSGNDILCALQLVYRFKKNQFKKALVNPSALFLCSYKGKNVKLTIVQERFLANSCTI